MFHFLQKKKFKKICNKGTINVLKVGGGGSAEYGQRLQFDHFLFLLGPFPYASVPFLYD